MLRAVATLTGSEVEVQFRTVPTDPPAEGEEESHAETGAEDSQQAEDAQGAEEAETQLNPIAPEVKEMLWGFGSFVVLAVLMRYVLYPRLRKGMDDRYRVITGGHEQAEQVTASARNDVAQYEQQLAGIRAEAQQRIDAARATLEGERADRLSQVNARIGEKRAAAAAEVEAARAAAQADVESAVRAVAARAGELATGRTPDADVVARAVADVMGAGVSR